MTYQGTAKNLKINYKKRIGTVVLVVEGASYEFKILERIFGGVLHYNLVEKSRNDNDFAYVDKYCMKGNENNNVIILNTSNSNINTIDENGYKDELHRFLYNKYNIDSTRIPIFYIWDRDRNSNTKGNVKKYIKKLTNPEGNEDYTNGLLILSYPAIETYTISCFENNLHVDEKLKDYVIKKKYYPSLIVKHRVLNAASVMYKQARKLGINDIDIDKMDIVNMKTYENEERHYEENSNYIMISYISIVLIYLGIITYD